MIAGLTPLDKGRVWLHGQDVTRLPPQKRNTGVVFQGYSLFRHMTVAENIAFGLDVRRVSKAAQAARVGELLSLIQLAGYGERYPDQLSGGQQQRVALARALAYEPEVLLLDEPFGALDVRIRTQLRRDVRAIQRRLGITAILVTHDQDEALELADQIGVIENGRLVEVGTPTALYQTPQHRYTAFFLGTANLIPAGWEGAKTEIMARPEAISVARHVGEVEGEVIGYGMVTETIFAGACERVSLTLESGVTVNALLTGETATQLSLHAGERLAVGVRSYRVISGESVIEGRAALRLVS